MEKETIIKQLLEAGVHFGHQTKRWNPKMQRFIFGERQGIYIIDLEKTAKALDEARQFLTNIAAKGGDILFVGTKKQAKDIVQAEASRCEMFYVNERWLGGTLTNFSTIRKSAARYSELKAIEEQVSAARLTKKESARLAKERDRLKKNIGGIVNMEKLPSVLFIIDPKHEDTAVKEANRLSIPIVALCDTNSDPDKITYVIPGNDDAIRAVNLITTLISDAILEGRKLFISKTEEKSKQKETEETKETESSLIKED